MVSVLLTFLSSKLTLGVFSSFLGSVSVIAYKKSLRNWKAGTSLFLLTGSLIGVISSLGIMLFHSGFQSFFDWKLFLLLTLMLVIQQWNAVSLTQINTFEKISTVQIFGNIRTFITLIAGFFLFGNTSIITLGIVLLAVCILFFSQYKGGTFEPPAAWKNMIVTFGISSFIGLSQIWFITSFGAVNFFVYASVLGLFVSAAFSLSGMQALKEDWEKIDLNSLKIRTVDGGLFQGVRYVSYFLISSVGPVVSTLLGMLSNITTLILGKIYLKETNTLKEWGINILLSVLVGVGFYFK